MAHIASITHTGRKPLSLRNVLAADAATCLAMAALLAGLPTRLEALLGLPATLLFWAGVVLIPCAALMALAAVKPSRALVWLIVLGNAAWVVASVLAALSFEPTAAGTAFVALQALAVAVLAWLEFRGLDRAT